MTKIKEIWKDIPGFEGLYQASNYGLIKSLYCRTQNKIRILKPSVSGGGYLGVSLCKNKRKTSIHIHKLIMITFSGYKHGYEINHKDFDKWNNAWSNLEYLTSKENVHHAMEFNSWPRGEKHGMSKVTEVIVREIRAKYIYKESRLDKPWKLYGLSKSGFYSILNRRIWKSVT